MLDTLPPGSASDNVSSRSLVRSALKGQRFYFAGGHNNSTNLSSRTSRVKCSCIPRFSEDSSFMRFVLVSLAIVGFVASGLALREHYRTDLSPCSINERWDCGIVNHSPYAMLFGIPVAVIGIAGYLLLGVLAFRRAYRVMLVTGFGGLGFALHLARIESVVRGVWCIYCAISLGVISLLSLLVLGTVIVNSMSRSRQTT